MGRLPMLLGVSVMLAVADPDTRARLKPHVDDLLAPTYEWSARQRASEISRALEAELVMGRSLPDPDRLQAFLRRRYPGSVEPLDPWGTPYYLRHYRGEVRVGSAGHDRRPHTSDDIVSPPIHRRRP